MHCAVWNINNTDEVTETWNYCTILLYDRTSNTYKANENAAALAALWRYASSSLPPAGKRQGQTQEIIPAQSNNSGQLFASGQQRPLTLTSLSTAPCPVIFSTILLFSILHYQEEEKDYQLYFIYFFSHWLENLVRSVWQKDKPLI